MFIIPPSIPWKKDHTQLLIDTIEDAIAEIDDIIIKNPMAKTRLPDLRAHLNKTLNKVREEV